MVRIRASSPVRSVAVTVLTLLFCGVLAPSRLDAGCAALDHTFDSEQLRQTFSPWIVGLAESARDVLATPSDPDAPKPCSGPSCSRNSAPPFTPVLREMWYVEHVALLPGVPTLPPPDSRYWGWKDTDRKPSPPPSGTFRPPRPAQAHELD